MRAPFGVGGRPRKPRPLVETTPRVCVYDLKKGAAAPALFAKEDEAKKFGLTKKQLEAAMRRLFKAGTICNEDIGKPSRPQYRIALKN
jgi:hypothetical protein